MKRPSGEKAGSVILKTLSVPRMIFVSESARDRRCKPKGLAKTIWLPSGEIAIVRRLKKGWPSGRFTENLTISAEAGRRGDRYTAVPPISPPASRAARAIGKTRCFEPTRRSETRVDESLGFAK